MNAPAGSNAGANAPVLPATIDVSVATAFERDGVTRKEWDDLVAAVGGDIYMTYDWCAIWWRHYGRGRAVRIFVFRQGGQLVGLAPMFVETVWMGPVGLRIGKRVGADFALTIFALPLSPAIAEMAYREVVSRLIEGERCDAVWIGFTPQNDPTLAGLRSACRDMRGAGILVDREDGPHTEFRLPETFERYLAGLEGRQRQNYQRRLRQLKKEFKLGSDTVKACEPAAAAFDLFRAEHEKQWLAEGMPGHFGDWPAATEFNRDLVETLSRSGRFRLVRMRADGVNLTSQYCFVFGDRCYWRLPARSTDPAFERLGLGVLGMVQLIEEMIKEGVRTIEAGVGHYDYKLRFGGEELRTRSVLVASRRFGVVSRVRIFLKLAELLHLIYYRLWFSRIAQRLPFRRRPIWRSWIRSRL